MSTSTPGLPLEDGLLEAPHNGCVERWFYRPVSDGYIFLVSQVTRPEDKNKPARPTMYMLKETGDIENEAEYVVLPYRDEKGKACDFENASMFVDKAKDGRAPIRLNARWDTRRNDFSGGDGSGESDGSGSGGEGEGLDCDAVAVGHMPLRRLTSQQYANAVRDPREVDRSGCSP